MMRVRRFVVVVRMGAMLVPLRAQPGLHVRHLARRIEERGAEQPVRRHLAIRRRHHGRAGIQTRQLTLQLGGARRVDQVDLGQQQPIGDCYLLHGFRMFIKLPPGIHCVDGRHDRIEPQEMAHHRIVQ